MKIKCIDNGSMNREDYWDSSDQLTEGKVYTVLSITKDDDGVKYYKISDDNNDKSEFFMGRFEVVKEKQDEKTSQ